MPSFDIYSEALEEAYVSAPSSTAILPTIELQHVSFTDDNNNPIAIRMVADPGVLIEERDDGPDIKGLMLTLEANASMNPSQSVLFQSVMFEFTLPEQSDSKVSGMQIKLDNVTKIVSKYLDKAVKQRSAMKLIYREYLSVDSTRPQVVIRNLSIKSATSNVFNVTAQADFLNLLNKKFPDKEYRPEEFQGLAV
jgi:hypothetical protein